MLVRRPINDVKWCDAVCVFARVLLNFFYYFSRSKRGMHLLMQACAEARDWCRLSTFNYCLFPLKKTFNFVWFLFLKKFSFYFVPNSTPFVSLISWEWDRTAQRMGHNTSLKEKGNKHEQSHFEYRLSFCDSVVRQACHVDHNNVDHNPLHHRMYRYCIEKERSWVLRLQ